MEWEEEEVQQKLASLQRLGKRKREIFPNLNMFMREERVGIEDTSTEERKW